MVARHEPVFYVRVRPVGAAQNEWYRMNLTGRVISFEYEDDENKADRIKLTVDNFGLEHFEDPVWKTGNKLEVSWGYPGSMAPARLCVIRKVTGFTQLAIEADGLEVIAQREKRFRVFENVKRSDAVRTIARELGYRSDDALQIQDTEEVLEQIVQANLTDAEFIRRLAEQEGFLFFVDWDGFHFHERNVGQNPVRVFRWYNIATGQPEILSLTVDEDVTAKPGRTKVKGRSPKSKTDIEAEQTAEQYKGAFVGTEEVVTDPETGERSVVGYSVFIPQSTIAQPEPASFIGSGAGGVPDVAPDPSLEPGQPLDPNTPAEPEASLPVIPPPPPTSSELPVETSPGDPVSSTEPTNEAATAGIGPTVEETPEGAQRVATTRYRKSKQKALKVKMRAIGVPTLVAKSAIELQNVGRRLAQNYYVRNVKHSISGGGYVIDVEMTADGAAARRARSRVVPGLRSIGVRAKRRKKTKSAPAEEIAAAPKAGEAVRNPDNPDTFIVRYGSEKREPVYFVAKEGYSYSEAPASSQVSEAPAPPTGVGGAPSVGPDPGAPTNTAVGGAGGTGGI